LAAALRSAGGGAFWVKMTHDARVLSEWSVAYEMPTPEFREKRIAALSEGSLGHELWPAFDIRPEDEIVLGDKAAIGVGRWLETEGSEGRLREAGRPARQQASWAGRSQSTRSSDEGG
jgi:hypothetical protein